MSRVRHLFVTCSSFVAVTLLTARAGGAPRTWGADEDDAAQTFPAPRPDEPRRTSPKEPKTPAPETPPPRAFLDYSDGTFYLRSAHDNLIIGTGGRVHVDTYAFAGPGVEAYRRSNGGALGASMFFRRFVIESGGLVRKHWFFWIGGNFAPTQVDSGQNTMSTAGVYDGFVGYQWPHAQLYVGQFNVPFTMENVTSSRWLDFMERALAIRTLATPHNKDLGITVWGASGEGVAPIEYQVGVFGGDGMNRPNVDHYGDAMARLVVHPFARATEKASHRAHVGVSGRFGARDDDHIQYDAPAFSTPGGYAFWSPRYTGTDGAEVHVMPSGRQAAAAAELYMPLERFDVKGELVYVDEGRREATASDRRTTLRRGRLEGVGAYLQLAYWPYGSPRINGHPGGRYIGLRAPKDRGAEHPYGLQILVRGELLDLAYHGNARTPSTPDGALSANTTRIRVTGLQGAVNYWATKHVRVTAEYSLYAAPGTPPAAGASASNQAAGPGAKSPGMPTHLHELSFRLGLAL